jgi:RNA polymerase-associated protein RTF1
MESCNMDVHKSSYLQAKIDDINRLLGRKWTSKEIQDKLDRQNKHRHLFRAPRRSVVGAVSLERDEALHRRNLESRRRNEEQVRKAQLLERRNRVRRGMQKRREEEARKRAEEEGKPAAFEAEAAAAAVKPEPIALYVPREAGSLTSMTRLKTDDEIIASIDMDIDIDI